MLARRAARTSLSRAAMHRKRHTYAVPNPTLEVRGPPSPAVLDYVSQRHNVYLAHRKFHRHRALLQGLGAAGVSTSSTGAIGERDAPGDAEGAALPQGLPPTTAPMKRARPAPSARPAPAVDGPGAGAGAARSKDEAPRPLAFATMPGRVFLVDSLKDEHAPYRAYFKDATVRALRAGPGGRGSAR